jgi:SAM-dependent methyltransferase
MWTISGVEGYRPKPNSWLRDDEAWGTSYAQWTACLYPRCFSFLKGRVLEIASGYGRWTQFLRLHCESLIGIDTSTDYVEYCRERFKNQPNLEFHTNNGLTFSMLPNESIDFAFSFDSVVYVDASRMFSYVRELARVLKPDGIAFIHHSNVETTRFPCFEQLKSRVTQVPSNKGRRASSMSALKMQKFAEQSGLSCIQQELIPWLDTSKLCECISTLVNAPNRECVSLKNYRFMEEAAAIKRISNERL